MRPPAFSWKLPAADFASLDVDATGASCGDALLGEWQQGGVAACNLFVVANEPQGSGRFFSVAFGVSDRNGAKPTRLRCLSTTTVWWRTLPSVSRELLMWPDDVEGDGNSEVMLWDSSRLHRSATQAEHGLMPWVCRFATPATLTLTLDPDMSRVMAGSLARKSRAPALAADGSTEALPQRAARELQAFSASRRAITNDDPARVR